MTSAALASLIEQVETVISNPAAKTAPVGDKSLDRALDDLRAACAEQKPLPAQIESFWH